VGRRHLLTAVGAIALALVLLPIAALAGALAIYPPSTVYRVLVWQESDVFDWQRFPFHPLEPAPTAHRFPVAIDAHVSREFSELAGQATGTRSSPNSTRRPSSSFAAAWWPTRGTSTGRSGTRWSRGGGRGSGGHARCSAKRVRRWRPREGHQAAAGRLCGPQSKSCGRAVGPGPGP
jgi:hypothetical protein